VNLRPLAVAAALLASPPAPAADVGAATELAQIMIPKSLWSQNLDGIGQQAQMQLASHPGSNLQYPADFQKTVKAELDKAFPYDEMIGSHAKELAASYTDAELKELLAFYRSPTGAKWLKTSGEVQGKADMATQQRLQERMPDIMMRLAKLGKPGPAAASGMPAGHPTTGSAPQKSAAPAQKKAEPAPAKK
jgi:hypothetical protein